MSRRTFARPASLTQRVVWALAGTVAVFVALLALLAHLAFDQMEDALVNDILRTETGELVERLDAGEPLPDRLEASDLQPDMRAWILPGAAGDAGDASLPEPLRGLPEGLHLLEPEGHTWHVMVVHAHTRRLVVLYDATEHERRVNEFGMIVLAMGLVCVLIAYLLARRVARLAVGPLLDLTDRLSNWAPGAPDFAIGRDDEAGRLVEAFNRVQNQVDRSIAREREFASNLSHEVRTPLAAIRSDSEMMLLDPATAPPARQRLERMVHAVDGIVGSLEGVRAMARDLPGRKSRFALAECVQDAWRAYADAARAAGLVLADQVPAGLTVELDRYALMIVLRNLIRNAIEHAAPAVLAVRPCEGGLELADDGRGIPAGDLPFLFERYYSGRLRDTAPAGAAGGPDGDGRDGDGRDGAGGRRRYRDGADEPRGLGLAIAKRVCDIQGWQLAVESDTEGPLRGTRFRLRFAGSE